MIGLAELAVLLSLAYFVPWVIAFVDLLRSDFPGNEKIVWLLALVLVPVVGMICYFAFGRRLKIAPRGGSDIRG